tara:strand:+ start:25469 stop:25606 length:138 start_codon:yes stop_codon:yes gene_type:complete
MNLSTRTITALELTSFVCMSNTNNKSLLSKTQNKAKNKTIAIGEK